MKIIIIRHAHTAQNDTGSLFSKTNIRLDQLGLEQADLLGYYLKDHPIDVLMSSPLSRAQQTTHAIHKYHSNIPFITHPALTEVDYGDAEGVKFKDLHKRFELNFESPLDEYHYAFPHGESLKDKVDQFISVIKDWKRQYTDQTVVLVTHGYSAKAIMIALGSTKFDKSFQQLRLGFTAITHIDLIPKPKITSLNQQPHFSLRSRLFYNINRNITRLRLNR